MAVATRNSFLSQRRPKREWTHLAPAARGSPRARTSSGVWTAPANDASTSMALRSKADVAARASAVERRQPSCCSCPVATASSSLRVSSHTAAVSASPVPAGRARDCRTSSVSRRAHPSAAGSESPIASTSGPVSHAASGMPAKAIPTARTRARDWGGDAASGPASTAAASPARACAASGREAGSASSAEAALPTAAAMDAAAHCMTENPTCDLRARSAALAGSSSWEPMSRLSSEAGCPGTSTSARAAQTALQAARHAPAAARGAMSAGAAPSSRLAALSCPSHA